MAKILFCDFFGVIIADSGNRFMNERGIGSLKDEIFPDSDIGKINGEELFARLEKVSGVDQKEIYDIFEKYARFIPSTVQSLKEVKKKYKIILISNAYEGIVERRIAQYHLEDLFDGLVISYQVHMVKPGREIYEYAYHKYAKKGDEIYYLDDNPLNFVEPKKLGFKTILFHEGMDIVKEMDKSIFY